MGDSPTPEFVLLPGSERAPLADAVATDTPLDGSERIQVTLITRRRAELPPGLIHGGMALTRDELAARHGTHPDDLDLIRVVMTSYGLDVTGADAASRRVQVTGTVAELASLFGAQLTSVFSRHPCGGSVIHRYRTGPLWLPAALGGAVTAVLGLDNRPQARPHYRLAAALGATVGAPGTFTPPQLGALYQFPPGTDGTGQTIGIIELGGGFPASDLATYFAGGPAPTVTAAGVDGAANVPGQDPGGADVEVLLDIEVAGALAPGAAQTVYFAPNTDQGFIDAVSEAVHATPAPAAVSISWGGPEDQWTAQSRAALDAALADGAALGVTVCVAAGDNGSGDGETDGQPHVDFPASSPHALACGGTTLTSAAETVWNDGTSGGATGGGFSAAFPPPAWQASAIAVPIGGRGVPDVAADADPRTGYQIYADGQPMVVGGTSAVAPLWAALIARLTQAAGWPLGFLPPLLYAGAIPGQAAPGFRDVTSGDNGVYGAEAGWDPCTGLGSPDGAALLARLAPTPAPQPAPPPAPTPTPAPPPPPAPAPPPWAPGPQNLLAELAALVKAAEANVARDIAAINAWLRAHGLAARTPADDRLDELAELIRTVAAGTRDVTELLAFLASHGL